MACLIKHEVELKMKFRVGDKVRIREFREAYRYQDPMFVESMKKLCGNEFVVDEIISGYIYYKGCKWHEDWLEFVEDEEEFDIDPDAFESVLLFM